MKTRVFERGDTAVADSFCVTERFSRNTARNCPSTVSVTNYAPSARKCGNSLAHRVASTFQPDSVPWPRRKRTKLLSKVSLSSIIHTPLIPDPSPL